ncbi:Non-specific lipid-transfer protein [Morella rubra]|nr:Non-specific lipid-transfer protein [Morella rubra]KAB1221795.1 Non-specific lipid-transfer protein [Morella rubra]KAB1221797.1 Non-specific lipid-transfer protein [Morella rubra]
MGKKLMRGWSVVAFGFVVLIFSACPSDAITCPEAIKSLAPCQDFLVGDAAKPSPFCCAGVQSILSQAGTPETRRDLCECFKKAAAAGGVKIDKAKQIPNSCGISLPVPIDPNVDCSK